LLCCPPSPPHIMQERHRVKCLSKQNVRSKNLPGLGLGPNKGVPFFPTGISFLSPKIHVSYKMWNEVE
jgi:hypothetical protein